MKYSYNSDETYSEIKGNKKVTINIIDENVLSTTDDLMNYNKETIYFLKNKIEAESEIDKKYYSASPIDGQ